VPIKHIMICTYIGLHVVAEIARILREIFVTLCKGVLSKSAAICNDHGGGKAEPGPVSRASFSSARPRFPSNVYMSVCFTCSVGGL
jgi:hypothetical protein